MLLHEMTECPERILFGEVGQQQLAHHKVDALTVPDLRRIDCICTQDSCEHILSIYKSVSFVKK